MSKKLLTFSLALMMIFAFTAFAAANSISVSSYEQLKSALEQAVGKSDVTFTINVEGDVYLPVGPTTIPNNVILNIQPGNFKFWANNGQTTLVNNGTINIYGILNYSNNIDNNGVIYAAPGSSIEGKKIEVSNDQRVKYTVTFDANGGIFTSNGKDKLVLNDIPNGSLLEVPVAPERQGFRFTGEWKLNNNTWNFDSDSVNGNITLKATWEKIESGGGTGCNCDPSCQCGANCNCEPCDCGNGCVCDCGDNCNCTTCNCDDGNNGCCDCGCGDCDCDDCDCECDGEDCTCGGDPTDPTNPTNPPTTTPPGSRGIVSNNTITILDDPVPLSFIADHIKFIYGYPGGDVRPNNNITRAEAAAIFHRLLANEDKDNYADSSYDDVGSADWYGASIAYLEMHGIVNGYPDGTFRPDANITRSEYAAMASRFDKLADVEENVFHDVDSDHWAVAFINSAYAKGWIEGFATGDFSPEEKITRAQVVTIVNRMLDRSITLENVPTEIINTYNDLTTSHWAFCAIIEASYNHEYDRNDDYREIWLGYNFGQ